ncbi:glutathione S-transferase family protein [Sphingomonas sp. KR3-1]|uniref:glutathione S-transferase family protein n=1 Tax=Sphingomonas sp. KR3-1 TaxID=3156611 RepID=UPI0032B43CA9
MLTLYDYRPSQNAWKVRQLLSHLSLDYSSIEISIFEGEGRSAEILKMSPSGKVPILVLEDGRALAESNAILAYLADGTHYLPTDAFDRAKVHQWMSFEQEQVESVIGSLRHWTMTGKLDRRSLEVVAGKKAAAIRALSILDAQFADRPFIAGGNYTIADISLYAYAGHSEEAGLETKPYSHFNDWRRRIRSQPGFLEARFPYSVDPNSRLELPG